MRKNKGGISLIVLVITIIVMIILAATIIISLNNTGIIGAAENAVCKTNIKQAQNLAVLTWSNIYTKPDEYTMDNIEEKLQEEFEKNGLKYEDYNVEVTKNGINVSSKAGCVDSSGVEGGSGNTGSDVIPTNWDYAYVYNRESDTWTAISTNEGIEPTGDVVVRAYKYGKYSEDGITTDTYEMIVSGSGEFDFAGLSEEDKVIRYIDGVGDFAVDMFLERLEIREGITKIGNKAFCGENIGCPFLKNIKLPNTLIEIGEGAFEYCTSLESLELPDSLVTIENRAFHGCDSLTALELPKNLVRLNTVGTEITKQIGAFDNCDNLEKIVVSGKLETWMFAFCDCHSLKEIIIEEGVKKIDNSAFFGCNKIEKIVIPTSVTKIDELYAGASYTMQTVKYRGTEAQWNAIEGKERIKYTTIEYNYTGN